MKFNLLFKVTVVLLFFLARFFAPAYLFIPLTCILLWVLKRICLYSGLIEKPALKLVFLAFWIRFIIGLSLFLISYFSIPIASSQHLPGGFWRFAPDAQLTHIGASGLIGKSVLNSNYSAIIDTMTADQLLWVKAIAAIYGLIGNSPLNIILINIFLATLQIVCAVLIASLFVRRKDALLSGWFVCLWPSSLLWSTQILKDSVSVSLLLMAFTFTLKLIMLRDKRFFYKIITTSGLVIVVFLLLQVRSYSALFFSMAIILGLIFSLLYDLVKRRKGNNLGYLFIAAGLSVATLAFYEPWLIKTKTQTPAEESVAPPAPVTQSPSKKLDQPTGPTAPSLPEKPVVQTPTMIASTINATSLKFKTANDLISKAWKNIVIRREGFIREKGDLFLPEKVTHCNSNSGKFVFFLLIFLGAWLTPFPFQWFHADGNSGFFRYFACLEMVLLYILLPNLLSGIYNLAKIYRKELIFFMAFMVISSLLLGITIPNIGAIFRLRYQFLVLLLILGVAGRNKKSIVLPKI